MHGERWAQGLLRGPGALCWGPVSTALGGPPGANAPSQGKEGSPPRGGSGRRKSEGQLFGRLHTQPCVSPAPTLQSEHQSRF